MKIASVILGVISIFLLIASGLTAYPGLYAIAAAKGSKAEVTSITLIMALVLMIGGLLCALIGIVFGMIGLFVDSAGRVPALIGLGLNLCVILSFAGIVLYGLYYLLENVKGRPFG